MPLSNSNISSTSPYDKLYEHIIVSQKAQGIRILIIVAPIGFGLLAIAIGISQGWFYAISIGIFAWLLCLGLLGCAIYMYRGLGYGTSDEKLIAISLDFLRTGKYGTSAVEIIGKRAEISSAGSPIRSILPVLLIPIIVSQLGNMGNTTLILPMYILLGLLLLSWPLVEDIYRSRIDSVIRHSIAEYGREAIIHQITRSDELLSELLCSQVKK